MNLTPLVLAFVAIPLLELIVLLRVGGMIGVGRTIALVLITGLVGAELVRRQGAQVLRLIQRDLAEGRLPAPHLIDGAMILAAGLLLITPGLLTDVAGILLLTPLVRQEIRAWLRRRLERKLRQGAIDIRFGGR
jgi:UPF0716 protein FxsA